MAPLIPPLGPAAIIAIVAIIAGVVIILCVLFRAPISRLVEGLTKATTPLGIVDSIAQQQKPLDSAIAEASAAPAKLLEGVSALTWIPGSTPPTIAAAEITVYATGAEPRSKTSDLAVYWFYLWFFESVYRVIWGSQIRLLQLADVKGTVTKAETEAFFNESRASGNQLQTFDSYMSFLTSGALLQQKGENYERTPAGHQFLTFLVASSLSTMKRF